ncbi:S-adenosyl-L-methionine-dependent methyltransferase [Alternaria rosae]|uniref:S-adenosyl-L-methionine-dependent methyltransferase n=1 Tax=Alternaria rosae TaxID=1187941 RepID=UPI001E8E77C0|nr:S-adenosyl-L-methionine-dependent methyltransferase [Alternaria rosae]KAH6873298.1 S-adenosyl-L-methionine-dependent methyltransferase [Alternaria rosae]
MATSVTDRVRKTKLRPLSSATNLTDFTHSTADPADSDAPSDGELNDFEVQSLTPSMYGVERKYGRTYHGFHAGAYPFPNDELEIYRLEWEHHIITGLLQGKHYFAPLNTKKSSRMLDIGCGTGQWCIAMAKKAPKHWRVEGIDLSAIQPKKDRLPNNVDFWLDNILKTSWWFPEKQPYTYDYVHTRFMHGIFTDFREVIQKGYNNLKPGGWMESQEIFSKLQCAEGMPDSYPLQEWSQLQDEAAHNLGRPLRIADKLKRWYREAGFVDVHEEVFALPVNPWPKENKSNMYGKFCMWNMLVGLHGWTIEYFVSGLGWTPAEVEVYLAHVRNSLADESVHAYYNFYVVWGRKPHDDEAGSTIPKPDHWPQPPSDDDESIFSSGVL